MENIKEYISDYLKNKCNATDYDINHSILYHFMDSLDIVDLIINIEQEYYIEVYDYETEWGELYVDDIVKYVKQKISENGE